MGRERRPERHATWCSGGLGRDYAVQRWVGVWWSGVGCSRAHQRGVDSTRWCSGVVGWDFSVHLNVITMLMLRSAGVGWMLAFT